MLVIAISVIASSLVTYSFCRISSLCSREEETAQEVPVQEQHIVNINKLRIKNGLEPITYGNQDIISIK